MRRFGFGFILLAMVVLTGCDFDDWGDSGRFREPFSSNHPLKSGGRLYLETFNGGVEILGWDKESAEISGEKYAATEDLLHQIKVDISSQPDSLRISVMRPFDRRGNFGASFVLHVPKRLMVDRVETSNGSLRVESIEGPVRMKSSNGGVKIWQVKGDIDITTSNAGIEVGQFEGAAILHSSNGRIRADGVRGAFEGNTSNGSIDVNITELSVGKPLRLDTSNSSINVTMAKWNHNDIYADTSNSSINVRLPEGINARFKGDTSNGSVTSEHEITVTNKGKTHLEGTIGSGGSSIVLDTSNGNIRLLKK